MKRTARVIMIGLTLSLGLHVAATAQQAGYLELLRSDLRAEKTAVMTESMVLADEQAAVFWPIYREYQHEVDRIGDEQLALIRDYADHYLTMTDEKAADLMKQSFKLEKKQYELRKKYHGKIRKALGGVVAARFVQLDRDLTMLIQLQASAPIPLVEATHTGAHGQP